jgi:hypothetical protein
LKNPSQKYGWWNGSKVPVPKTNKKKTYEARHGGIPL